MPPLICTSNTQSHVDYGIPIIASKSTDYRTCTGTYHRYIPSFPQYPDCRVKAKIKKELVEKDVGLRDNIKSSYSNDYYFKTNQDDLSTQHPRSLGLDAVKSVRNLQEKVTKSPPVPTFPKISEMKDCYRRNNYKPTEFGQKLTPPLSSHCEITGLERPLQPTISPGSTGYWKYLDIYMTENRLQYVPYTEDQIEQSKDDIITYYSGTGQYKKLKKELPSSLTGNKTIYDKAIFKQQYPNKFLTRGQKRCPNFGMQSEYQGNYAPPSASDSIPYIHERGEPLEDSLSGAGPWQNLCIPGMYCTEYCHIGSAGYPVRCVVDTGKHENEIVHPGCEKVL